MLQSFKQLTVWQRAMELAREVYDLSKQLPKDEQYGLSSQIRRAAVSSASNIAEGYKRRSTGEYVRFLAIADASAAELETQLLLIQDVYPNVPCERALSLNDEVQKMLAALIRKLTPIPSSLVPKEFHA